jgi:hypothetical protein
MRMHCLIDMPGRIRRMHRERLAIRGSCDAMRAASTHDRAMRGKAPARGRN